MSAQSTSHWRLATAVVGLIVAVPVLTACSGDDEQVDPVESAVYDTATRFVTALVEGRYDDAVELSDAQPQDFACSWLLADRRARPWLAASVESVTISDDGTQARAQTMYNEAEESSLDLVGGGTEWTVALPDAYRMDMAFSGPAVVQMDLRERATADLYSPAGPEDPQECVIKPQDGTFSVKAFPSVYSVMFIDPTGVVDYPPVGGLLEVDGEEVPVHDLGDPIRERELDRLKNQMLFAHLSDRVLCGEAPCEAGTFDESAELSLVKVWTDDEEQWSAEVEQGDQTFTGTLERSADGDLIFAVEPAT